MRVRRHTVVFCLLIFPSPGMLRAKTLRSRVDSERFFGNWIGMFRNSGVILVGSLWIALSSLVYGSEATADQHTARAVQLVKEGKDKEALEEFTKAIEADSKNPMFYRNRAALCSRMKDWEHAAVDYTQVLSLQPDDLTSQLNRGIAFTEAKKFDEAEKDFAAVLAKKPDEQRALKYQAYVLAAKKDTGQAAEEVAKLIEKNPTDPKLYLSRAQIYAAGAKWQEAIAHSSRGLEIDGKNVEALTGSANPYIQGKYNAKALEDLTALLSIKPNDPVALFPRGD